MNHEGGTVDSRLTPLIRKAMADLAARERVELREIHALVAEMVVWPDGSLGCPQEGLEHRQVQVDGYRIVLAVHGEEFAYHGGGGRGPFLCWEPDSLS